MKEKRFKIIDIDSTLIVEIARTQKEIFEWMDEFIQNLEMDVSNDDETFQILYKDGKEEYINHEYDGHKIHRKNIRSIVYNNDSTAMTYGPFEINEYGVVSVSCSDVTTIANENIKEIR